VIADSIQDVHGAIHDHPVRLKNDEYPEHILVSCLVDARTALESVDDQEDEPIAKDDIAESVGYQAATEMVSRLDLSGEGPDPEMTIRLASRQCLVNLPIWEWEGWFTALQPILRNINRSHGQADDLSEVVTSEMETVTA
jgi:hypothetical protein